MKLAIDKKMLEDVNPRLSIRSEPIIDDAKPKDDHLMKGADDVLLVDLKMVDGVEYIVHKVTSKCSINNISMKYNVPIFTIKQANGLAND
jgi:hypothetical protein